MIAGLVLDLPVLGLDRSHQDELHPQRAPAAAGHLAVPWLTIEPPVRLVGLPGRIPLRSFDWTARAADLATPTLILHGSNDDSAPIRLSRQALRDRPPGARRVETFDAAHTLAWNTDPDRWQATVTSWLRACISG